MLLYYGLIPLFALVSYCFLVYDVEFLFKNDSVDLFRVTNFYKTRKWMGYFIPIFCVLMVVGMVYWLIQNPSIRTILCAIILIAGAINNGPNVVNPLKVLTSEKETPIDEKRTLFQKVALGHLIDMVCFAVVLGLSIYWENDKFDKAINFGDVGFNLFDKFFEKVIKLNT